MKKRTHIKSLKRWDVIVSYLDPAAQLIGAEVGVWAGKCSEQLLAKLPRLFLYMVDRWIQTPPGDSYFKGSRIMSRHPQYQFDRALDETKQRVKKFNGRYSIIKNESIQAASMVPDDLDFVFIDGDHSFEGTVRDIDVWVPKVRSGGIVFFHDYENGNTYGDVRGAIEDRIGVGKVVVSPYDHVAIYRKD